VAAIISLTSTREFPLQMRLRSYRLWMGRAEQRTENTPWPVVPSKPGK